MRQAARVVTIGLVGRQRLQRLMGPADSRDRQQARRIRIDRDRSVNVGQHRHVHLLELAAQARSDHRHRPTVTIISGVDNELVIKRKARP